MSARHDINQQTVDMMELNQAATTSPLQGWDMRHITICVSNHPGQVIAQCPGSLSMWHIEQVLFIPVSYTHLTLPTILIV